MRPALSGLLAGLVVTSLLLPNSRADEGESAVSAGAYFSTFSLPDHAPLGGALGVDYERGITEVMWLRASAAGGLYLDSPDDTATRKAAYAAQGSLGISYALDVLRYVPFVTLGLGGSYFGGEGLGEDVGFYPMIQLGGGLNVLESPDFSWGVQATLETFVTRSALLMVGLRVSHRWGFF